MSRIGREYEASDRRQCFVACPHCGDRAAARMGHGEVGEGARRRHGRPGTSRTVRWCGSTGPRRPRSLCEAEAAGRSVSGGGAQGRAPGARARPGPRVAADPPLRVLRRDAGPGGMGRGRPVAVPDLRRARSAYDGHAGFQAQQALLDAPQAADAREGIPGRQGRPELMRKFVNTGLAEQWEPSAATASTGRSSSTAPRPTGPTTCPRRCAP